jgi:hypothetical protein
MTFSLVKGVWVIMNNPRSDNVGLNLGLLSSGFPIEGGTRNRLNKERNISVTKVIEELRDHWKEESCGQLNTKKFGDRVMVHRDLEDLSGDNCLNNLVKRER